MIQHIKNGLFFLRNFYSITPIHILNKNTQTAFKNLQKDLDKNEYITNFAKILFSEKNNEEKLEEQVFLYKHIIKNLDSEKYNKISQEDLWLLIEYTLSWFLDIKKDLINNLWKDDYLYSLILFNMYEKTLWLIEYKELPLNINIDLKYFKDKNFSNKLSWMLNRSITKENSRNIKIHIKNMNNINNKIIENIENFILDNININNKIEYILYTNTEEYKNITEKSNLLGDNIKYILNVKDIKSDLSFYEKQWIGTFIWLEYSLSDNLKNNITAFETINDFCVKNNNIFKLNITKIKNENLIDFYKEIFNNYKDKELSNIHEIWLFNLLLEYWLFWILWKKNNKIINSLNSINEILAQDNIKKHITEQLIKENYFSNMYVEYNINKKNNLYNIEELPIETVDELQINESISKKQKENLINLGGCILPIKCDKINFNLLEKHIINNTFF